MKRLLRKQSGFTLIELMVVVSILAVLAAIVSGGVVGTKSRGELSQTQSDGQATQQAAGLFNNTSRGDVWPEVAIASSALSGYTSGAYQFDTYYVSQSYLTWPGFLGDGSVNNFSYVSWAAVADVRTSTGSVASATFVPDFLLQKPDSTRMSRLGSPEYLWLFKKGSSFSDQGRSVQVYKMNDAGTAYVKVFPQVTN